MPAYENVCKACSKDFMVFRSIKEFEATPNIKCPHCESDNVQNKLTGFSTKTCKKS